MCGILFNNDKGITFKSFEEALSLMNHRGPDYQGIKRFKNDEVKLGHNRLSIIDLDSRSNQPFSIHGIHLIYNGEIYNYKELVNQHDLNLETKSDTEVVLRMYMKYGSDCLQYFNGMFAFVIYDEQKDDFFAARDRLGIKPLYIRQVNGKMTLSSEVAPILELYDSDFDKFGIRQYKKLRMTLKGYTLYEDVKMFPAGHYYLNGEFYQYWNLDISSKPAPSYEKLKFLLEDSVSIRKRADVSVGSYLSGGLDSTILSFIAKPEFTWTVGFEQMNEFKWSSLANESLKSCHKQVLVDEEEFIRVGKWMIKKRKEPLAVPNEVLIYLMTRKVKEENTVILSGEGADELFWGYDRIFKWAKEANELTVEEFDRRYCYGTEDDNEVIDFAIHDLVGKTVLEKVAYFFQKYHLHGLLRRLDNSTMLCSVEGRVPFVDHRLVEMMAGTPFKWRMGDNVNKEPLKIIYKEIIPNEIIERKKMGFPVPLDEIFTGSNYSNIESSSKTGYDFWFNFNLENLKS